MKKYLNYESVPKAGSRLLGDAINPNLLIVEHSDFLFSEQLKDTWFRYVQLVAQKIIQTKTIVNLVHYKRFSRLVGTGRRKPSHHGQTMLIHSNVTKPLALNHKHAAIDVLRR